MNDNTRLSPVPRSRRGACVALAVLLVGGAVARPARAHGDQAHAKKNEPVRKEQQDWGVAGERGAARRTVQVGMDDRMRFTPAALTVRQGETVRFVVQNQGKVMHEFVIGTRAENAKHAELMMKFPNMEHDEPWMAHVPPGRTGEIVWTFNRAGNFEFACLIAGHYQAGMVGTITVTPA